MRNKSGHLIAAAVAMSLTTYGSIDTSDLSSKYVRPSTSTPASRKARAVKKKARKTNRRNKK